MAVAIRRRIRRPRARGVSNWFRSKALGVAFIALAPVIIGILGLLMNIMPSLYIYVHNDTLGAGTTLPTGATGVDVKLFVAILGFLFVVLVFISGLRRVSGVRI